MSLGRRDQALLVRLADGTLDGRSRMRAEARLRAIPDGERLLERQRRVARALGAEPLPAAPPVVRRAPLLAVAGALAVTLLLLVALAVQDTSSTVERAASLSQLPAAAAAPERSGDFLRADVQGVRFPDWGPEFGWHATGLRRDELDGRDTTTVFYEHEGHRLAYTIVSGPALPRPADAQVVEHDGVEISVYRDPGHGGHDVAVFERDGRTCVVAGHVLRLSTLLDLAAWKRA
jgi:hypothetical protein